jgi:hypothetical protein
MFLRQIPDPHLSQYAYLIGCQRTGEALVVDPERDIDRYREVAAQEGLKISAVAETHIHADFVSGAREFADADPSLKIYLSAEGGPDWQSEWVDGLPNVIRLRDGDVFEVGNIEMLHVTGTSIHRAVSTSLMVIFLISLSGVGAQWLPGQEFPMPVSVLFVAGGFGGMILGGGLRSRLSALTLRRVFAIGMCVVGAAMLGKNIIVLHT